MPLRDHFQTNNRRHRMHESVLGGWPMALAMRLQSILPPEYVAAPRVRLGVNFEVDVGAGEAFGSSWRPPESAGGVVTLPYAPPAPTALLDADLDDHDAYELLIHELDWSDRLLAAVEFVSPRNKDRPAARRQFAEKVAALLRRDVCVAIVDFVTERRANLYAETLDLIGEVDPGLSSPPPPSYAVSCRRAGGRRLESWAWQLEIGDSLPSPPLWLTPELALALPLEDSYEDVCRTLRMDPPAPA